jgi:carboxylesterase
MAQTARDDFSTVEKVLFQAFSAPQCQPFDFTGEAGSTLLVHGFPGTPADVRPLGEALRDSGWGARGILMPGFGTDIATLPQRRAEDWIAAVVENLHELRGRGKPVILIGHSMGAATALCAAAQVPPDRLILLAPFWKIEQFFWRLMPAIKRVIPSFQPLKLINMNFDDPDMRKSLAEMMPGADLSDDTMRQTIRELRIPTSMVNEVRRVGLMGAACAPSLRMPTLIIQGSDDQLVQPALTRTLATRFSPPPIYIEVNGMHDIQEPDQPAWAAVRHEVLKFTVNERNE